MRPSFRLLLALLLPSSIALAGPEVDDELVAALPVEARVQLGLMVEELAGAEAALDAAKAERKARQGELRDEKDGVKDVNSEEEAELAYLGLDDAIGKAMDLGFDGFNDADSANIAQQETTGAITGTLFVNGQVDQGSSDNKGMRLDLTLDEYCDFVDLDADGEREISVTYWTDPDSALPALDLQLRDIPDGTFDGTMSGSFGMEGDIVGDVELAVDIDGRIESDGDGGTRRESGSTTIVGTATGPSGHSYDIDITL